ncbi:MAG TPA: transglutaminase domain-containing protein [Acidobacteriaceae bacterium]|nr:transglutaminase domain-containing protein [Acidobacteriaceae bacterium]
MTSDPDAPGAPAVYLERDVTVNDEQHFHSVFAEIKILTEKGREEYSDIPILLEQSTWNPYYIPGDAQITGVEGRTIEPDGTVVPFTGKPFRKDVVVTSGYKVTETLFTMPQVQVGSILEYRWEFTYGEYSMNPPNWVLRQSLFVHKAHYRYVMSGSSIGFVDIRDAQGHEHMANEMLCYHILPKGAKATMLRDTNGNMTSYDLVVDNMPAIPEENFTPPLNSFSYRVAFYYSFGGRGSEYWRIEGDSWSKEVERFAASSDAIKAAVAQIVSPGDNDPQKLEKIYAAVMTVENTDFTREHTEQENKATGEKTKTAADIWANKRGDSNQITLLFIAMVRAAGMKSYAMMTTDRRYAFMNPGILDWDQLTDEVAIVNLDGKDMYFDPGDRYCVFGKLGWIHTQMLGIRQTDDGTAELLLPPGSYLDNETFRKADLTVAADGGMRGQIQVIMKGVEALRWRQDALRQDAEKAQRDFENAMQKRVPDGVHVKMDGFEALTDPTANLVATLDISGTMGTTAGKRLIVPAEFFEANVKPPFAAQTRQNPIDVRYPFAQQDEVTMTLGPGLTVESLPQGTAIPMAKGGEYKSIYSQTGGSYTAVRLMALGNTIFSQQDYPMLRGFFQNAAAQDQEQVVLRRTR